MFSIAIHEQRVCSSLNLKQVLAQVQHSNEDSKKPCQLTSVFYLQRWMVSSFSLDTDCSIAVDSAEPQRSRKRQRLEVA